MNMAARAPTGPASKATGTLRVVAPAPAPGPRPGQADRKPHPCPLCGGPLPENGILVSLDDNTIVVGGVAMKVQPKVAELAERLRRSMPETVRFEAIFNALYGLADDVPDNPRQIISVLVHKLRAVLKDTAFSVENSFSRGYRMVRRGGDGR